MKYLMSILLASAAILPLAATAHATDLAPNIPADTAAYTGIYLRGDLGASWLNWGSATNNMSYVGDAGIGYQVDQNWRTDLTYNWTGDYNIAPGSTLHTNIVMGNVYFDWKNSTPITPYVGVGAGYGWQSATGGGAFNSSGLAVGLRAGVAYDFTSNLALDVGYRFNDILVSGQNTPEHQVAAGLRVKF